MFYSIPFTVLVKPHLLFHVVFIPLYLFRFMFTILLDTTGHYLTCFHLFPWAVLESWDFLTIPVHSILYISLISKIQCPSLAECWFLLRGNPSNQAKALKSINLWIHMEQNENAFKHKNTHDLRSTNKLQKVKLQSVNFLFEFYWNGTL